MMNNAQSASAIQPDRTYRAGIAHQKPSELGADQTTNQPSFQRGGLRDYRMRIRRKMRVLVALISLCLVFCGGLICGVLYTGPAKSNQLEHVWSRQSDFEVYMFRNSRKSYLLNEGPDHRGKSFQQMTASINSSRLRGDRFTADEIVGYLGLPDLCYRRGQMQYFQYYYDVNATADGCLFLEFSKSILHSVSYGQNPELITASTQGSSK